MSEFDKWWEKQTPPYPVDNMDEIIIFGCRKFSLLAWTHQQKKIDRLIMGIDHISDKPLYTMEKGSRFLYQLLKEVEGM